MDNNLTSNMRARLEQCRRLTKYTTDEYTRQVLLSMADEIEADLKRLHAESDRSGAQPLTQTDLPLPAHRSDEGESEQVK